jgi:hypothetical protein
MTKLANYVIKVLENYVYILTMWLHLATVPGCTTLKSSIMVNTRWTRGACQSNTATSVPSNPWILSIVGITCVSTLEPVGSTE